MNYIEFHIKQVGKTLSCSDSAGKIIINKYDNKVSKIIFNLDGTIPGRVYFALRNPVTGRYFISPIINNELVIGTKVSIYPGRWTALLIGIDDDYEIVDDEIDQSKCTYVSDEFKRIIVRDNFLDDCCIEEESSPVIDMMIDNLIKSQDRLENAAITAEESVQDVVQIRDEILKLKEEILTMYNELIMPT